MSTDVVIAEMQVLMRSLAMPALPGEGAKAAIGRAARRAGLSWGVAKRLWYGERRLIPTELSDRIRKTAAAQEAEAAAVEEARAEIEILRARIVRLEALAAAHNQGADSEEVRPVG